MKKIAIVYSSKYGHTKQYADWLKEDVDADVIDISKFNITQMLAYKLVIFACGVYGDKLSIMDFVKKNVTAIPTQKTMIMAVGWYTNDSKEASEKLMADNYPPEFKGKVPMYVVNSGLDKKQISKMDSVKLVAAKLAIEKKDGRSTDDINALGILNGYSNPTSKDNLASIKKGIDEFLNPPQAAPSPAAAPKAAAPAPKPSPAPKPASAAQPAKPPVNEADALANSVEEAFKHLGAKPVIHNPEPPKPEPKAEAPAPAAEEQSADPVIKFNANGKVVVSSVLDAINSLNGTPQTQQPAPKPAPAVEPKPEPVAEVKPTPVAAPKPAPVAEPKPAPVAEPKPAPAVEPKPAPAVEPKPAPAVEPKPEPVAEPKPAPVVEPKPEPVAEPAPAPVAEAKPEPPKKTNSYMELFAKRRRATVEEAPKAEETAAPASEIPVPEIPKPAPVPQPEPAPVPKQEAAPSPAPIPRPAPTPIADIDLGDLDFGAAASTASTPAPTPAPVPAPQPAPSASDELDLDSYDFIGDSKPAVSSRALNAVQALAKAKEDAEREAAQKAKELAAEQEAARNGGYNTSEEQGFEMSANEDDGIVVEASNPADYEEESDGLEAFEFTNDFDYDVEAELDIKFVEPEPIEPVKHESKNDIDIKKLQEEINAEIESNRAAKEKMMARYNKKKEEVHNPFAVQFDEDEDKKKRKSKKAAKAEAEPKFLEDPIDPDIFFSKRSKDDGFNSGSMPEIKFKH